MRNITHRLSRLALPLMLVALGLLYVGERVLDGSPRVVVSALGAALVVLAFTISVARWLIASGDQRSAHFWLVLAYKVVADSLLIYCVQSDWLAWLSEGGVYVVAQVLWPFLLVLGLVPAIAMERALAAMSASPQIELSRVSRAARGALIIGLGLISFAAINYVGARWNKKVDLSYFRTTEPSESTRALVESIDQPTEVYLFYPGSNEVLARIQDYTDVLDPLSDAFTVTAIDQALDPALARELKVRDNGVIGFRSGKNTETLNISTDLAGARRMLRRLDEEFQKRLIKVSRPERVAYFTVGHAEREYSGSKKDPRPGFSDFKGLLEGLGFRCLKLGLSGGLGDEIPEQATLLVIAGPLEPFLEAERAAVERYLRRGGSVLMFADPDHGKVDSELLRVFGTRMPAGLAADSNTQIRVPGKALSPYNFATNQTALHPMSRSFRSVSRGFFYATIGSGALKKLAQPVPGVTLRAVVQSRPGAFVDANGDGELQPNEEEKEKARLSLVVAAEVARDDESDEGHSELEELQVDDAKTNASGKPSKSGRVVVFGDADAGANGLIRNAGNAYLIADGVRWLAHDEEVAKGAPATEEDVKIVHREEDDALWFYGATLATPGLVLALGLLYTSRRRRRHS